MEIVGYILAVIGLACVIKHLSHQEGCVLCGWRKTKGEEPETKPEEPKIKQEEPKTKLENIKTKVEGIKTKAEEIKTKVEGIKTKVEGKKRTGSRYGSNPVQY
jgi:hypothetical protein